MSGSRDSWMTSSRPEKNLKRQFLCFSLKKTKQKFSCLEALIGILALVVGKLWPRNDINNLLMNPYRVVSRAGLCGSGRAFRVGPGSGLSLSKCFWPILCLHTQVFIPFEVTTFSFLKYISSAHCGYFCEWSDCDIFSANSICKYSCVL